VEDRPKRQDKPEKNVPCDYWLKDMTESGVYVPNRDITDKYSLNVCIFLSLSISMTKKNMYLFVLRSFQYSRLLETLLLPLLHLPFSLYSHVSHKKKINQSKTQKQNGHGATSTVFICRNKETQKQFAAKRVDKKKMIAMVRYIQFHTPHQNLLYLLIHVPPLQNTHSMHINKDLSPNVW